MKCSDELKKLQDDDGTYTSASLGSNHEVNEERDYKILGTTWNHDTDHRQPRRAVSEINL